MTAADAVLPTLGLRLDAALARAAAAADALSSTQLYVATVTVMVLVSFAVLSPAHPAHRSGNGAEERREEPGAANSTTTANDNSGSHTSSRGAVKPAWHGCLRTVNFAALACFLASLVAFFNNAQAYSAQAPILYKFLLGWSAYLGYFFSFSGVSLLYDSLDEDKVEAAAAAAPPRYDLLFRCWRGVFFFYGFACLTLFIFSPPNAQQQQQQPPSHQDPFGCH